MSDRKFQSYDEFWAFYLEEHSKPATRLWHLVGTLSGIAVAVGLGLTHHARWIPLALLPAYGCAWFSHFFIQSNRPATWSHPLWSLVSDFRMAWWMLVGKI